MEVVQGCQADLKYVEDGLAVCCFVITLWGSAHVMLVPESGMTIDNW